MRIRSDIARAGITLFQAVGLAIWLEFAVTLKWVYPHCDFPIFGWPWPYRAYSECCSLEYTVDWWKYAIDMAFYFAISGAIVLGLQKSGAMRARILDIILMGIAFASIPWLYLELESYRGKTSYEMGDLRNVGVVFAQVGYGTCQPEQR